MNKVPGVFRTPDYPGLSLPRPDHHPDTEQLLAFVSRRNVPDRIKEILGKSEVKVDRRQKGSNGSCDSNAFVGFANFEAVGSDYIHDHQAINAASDGDDIHLMASFLHLYEPLDIIGNGSFGVIRKVRRKSDGLVCRFGMTCVLI